MKDFKQAAERFLRDYPDLKVPQAPLIGMTESAAFVEVVLEIGRCLICGDALLPCEACSVICCSNGLCGESKHAGCPAMEETR